MSKILNSENSKMIVKTILKKREGVEITESTVKNFDFEVKENFKTYSIKVYYGNIPNPETKSRPFEWERLKRLEELCTDTSIPTIAYALYDEDFKKIYVLIMTLEQMYKVAEKEKEFFKRVKNGLQVKSRTETEPLTDLIENSKNFFDTTIINIDIEKSEKNFFE